MSFLEAESTLLTFDINDLDDYLDVHNLRMFQYGVQGTRLAVATLRYLLVMEGSREPQAVVGGVPRMQHIQIANFVPEYGYPMCLSWLLGGVLAVGFDSGYVVCFDDTASVLSERKFCDSALVAMQVEFVPTMRLWLLYENGTCISVLVSAVVGEGENVNGILTRLRISDQSVCNDFLFLPPTFHSLFDGGNADLLKKQMIVAGTEKSLCLVDIDGGSSKSHSGKPVTPKKEKSRSFFSSIFGSSTAASPSSSGRSSPAPHEAIQSALSGSAEVNTLVFFDDPKRRILRVSVDPSGKLISTADNVGRVMLFDARVFAAIRMWKGLREARLAWTEGVRPDDSDGNVPSEPCSGGGDRPVLCLAIYSPMTGLCNLWTMKHGPCLRSVPVGPQCYIYTVYANRRSGPGEVDTERSPAAFGHNAYPHANNNLTTCILLMHDQSKLILSRLTPFGKSKGDLDAHKLDLMLDLEHEALSGDGAFAVSGDIVGDIESDATNAVEHEVRGSDNEAPGFAETHPVTNSSLFLSLEECKLGVHTINSFLEDGLLKVKSILDMYGCRSEILRNDAKSLADELINDLEAKILPIAERLTFHETAVVCLSLIDRFEMDAFSLLSCARCGLVDGLKSSGISPMKETVASSGLSPAFQSRGPVAADQRIESLRIGSSSRWLNFCFTPGFHRALICVLESCGKMYANYGTLVEVEVRTRLLKAYESLLEINSTITVSTTVSEGSDNGGGIGSAGSLMRYGEWRSEAFRWASRRHRLEEVKTHNGSGAIPNTTSGHKSTSADNRRTPPPLSIPPPPGASIDIINMSPSSGSSMNKFGDRPVIRKGFSFADVRPRSIDTDDRTNESSVPVSGGGFSRGSYVLPNVTSHHRMTAVAGAINCNPHCLHRINQETDEGSYMAACPIVPFGILRAMHSVEPVGEYNNTIAVTFRGSILESLISSDSILEDVASNVTGGAGSAPRNKTVIKLDNCLSLTKNNDSGSVSAGESSYKIFFGSAKNDHSPQYSTLLASSALTSAEKEQVADIGWIPERIRENDWTPDSSSMWDLLSLFCSPLLFSDPFNLPSFSKAMISVGLGSGTGLYFMMAYIGNFVDKMPISVLLNSYYNKPPVSVLLFRWLKEVLLDFFQFYATDEEEYDTENDNTSMTRNNFNSCTTRDELLIRLAQCERAPVTTLFPGLYRKQKPENDENSSEEDEISFNNKLVLANYPTFDEVVRVLFKPAWVALQKTSHLEHAMTFASIVLDILEPVSDQTERRSKGSYGLSLSKMVWERFLKQIRICLLLSLSSSNAFMHNQNNTIGRLAHNADISVAKLASGEISIFRLLAEDTLCFAELPEHAVSHELRCLEVSKRNSVSGSNSTVGATLQAWGSVADSRWKELFAIAEAEDLAFASNFEKTGIDARLLSSADLPLKKPASKGALLTSSPKRGRDNFFSGGGEKVSNGKKGVTNTQDISPIDSGKSAAHSAKKVSRRRPLLILFPHHNLQEPLGAYRAMILAERWCKRPKKVEKLSLSADHLHSLPRLSRAIVAELILGEAVLPLLRTYLDIEENVFSAHTGRMQDALRSAPQTAADTGLKASKTSTNGQELLSVMSEAQSAREIIRASIDFFSYISEGNECLLSDGVPLSEANEENVSPSCSDADAVWPTVSDARLLRLRKKFCVRGGVPMLTIDAHLALLCVLQLRAECGLRGIRPSRLFGVDMTDMLCSRGVLGNLDAHIDMNVVAGSDENEENATSSVRTEFIMQCFRQLGAMRSPILYRLSALWQYSLHDVRIMHINALLDLYLDELVDEMIPQIANFYAVVDCITEKIRLRLGVSLLRLENLSGGIDLLPLVDPDAASWCKLGLPAPETPVLEAIMRGRSRIADYNLNSTKHLVIQIQALLLSVPSIRRDDSWVARKQHCDALHGLCSFLFSPSAQAKLQRKGLSL